MTRSAASLALLLALAATACGDRDAGSGANAGGGAAGGSAAQPARARAQASLLLLTLDTTRADHLEPYGGPAGATPHLADLARAGALFERVYAAAPTTLPAHATLMTGLDPTRHGVRHNGVHHLLDEAVTLAELLQGEDLATAAFVSSSVLERRYGLSQGFDLYDDEASSTRLALGRYAERAAAETVDRALAWLDGLPAGERFFLWVHLYDPHAEYAPPPPFAQRWAADLYSGEIAYMDEQIGRLLAHPRLSDGTVVSAIGDHGESLEEHGEANHGMLLYEAALRVPWIVRGPGIAPGRRVARAAGQIDLTRTLLELLGVVDSRPVPDQGVSWASELRADRDGAVANAGERTLYSETLAPFLSYGWAPLHAVRRGDWKLIDAPSPELYDTQRDPAEQENRIAQEKAIARELGRELQAIAASDSGAAQALPLDAGEAEKLRSLGYLTTAHPRRREGPLPDPKTMMPVHRLLGEAQEALLRGDPQSAATRLESVLARDSGNVTALETQATALTRLGRLDRAEATLASALTLDPRRPSLLLAAAALRSQSGKPEDALTLAEEAVKVDVRNAEARVAVARYQAALGRAEAAAASARGALEIAPGSAMAEIAYADLVERPADVAAAESRLRRVVEREPLLPEGWLSLGAVLEERNRTAEAEAVYRRGLAQQPGAGQLHAALGVLLAQQQRPDAQEPLERAAALLHPVPASVERGLALVAIRNRDWDTAERSTRAALTHNDRDAFAWTLLAAVHEEKRDADAALAAYDRARGADPDYLPALFNRALLLRRLGRFADSAAQLEEVLARDDAHAKAHYELGILMSGPLRDPAAARRHFELALASGHPDRAGIRRALAELSSAASQP